MPLIILTPKSLLRADSIKSTRAELEKGAFEVILPDIEPPKSVDRVIFCSGKIAHELFDYRKQNQIKNTMIIRLEQLYPFPFDQIKKTLTEFKDARQLRWVQEEPRNMGTWNFVLDRFQKILPKNRQIEYVGRLPSASPAAGSYQMHLAEHNLLLRQAFE
jgi:2-oxoglutarate dehydrogenase E1 component